MKRLIIILTVFHSVFACVQADYIRKLITIGMSEGVGGPHLLLSPTIDFILRKTILKFSSIPPYPRYLSIGLTRELKTYKNDKLVWIASLNYFQINDYYWHVIIDGSSYRNISFLSGIRVSLFRSLKLNAQLGISLMKQIAGYSHIESHNILPYGEFSLSFDIINIIKKDDSS